MSFTAVAGALAPIVSAGASLVGSLVQTKHNDHWNQKNLDFQKEQFQYQKYLNNNQTQIQAADAQKAGINPLAMNGGSLTSGSYSNVSSPMDNPLSGFSSAILDYMNMRNQRQMNEATNEANSVNVQKELDTQYKIESEKLAQQNYQFEMDYILKNRGMTVEEREQARKEAYDRYLASRDSARLAEDKYEFDVTNERLVHELNKKMKSFKANQIESAFNTWRSMQMKSGNSVNTTGSEIVGLYNVLKDGFSTLRDVIDNNTWNKDQKAFWIWFNEHYDFDGEYHSEYSRK